MKENLHIGQKGYFFRGDPWIWLIVLILMLISIVEVYSTTASLAYRIAGGDTGRYLLKQIGILTLGGAAMFFFQMLKTDYYVRLVKPILRIMGVLLLLTLFFGMQANSARRWTQILGMTLQPSDLVRIPLILYISFLLTEKRERLKDFSYILYPILFAIGSICALILPANFSTAALLGFTCFLMLIIGKVRWKHLLIILFLAVGGFFVFVKIAPSLPLPTRVETWASRWNAFYDGEVGFQSLHAKIAIANGIPWGKGPGNSLQRLVLPESYSDFIYANIVEEFGVIGGGVVLFLYLALLYRILIIIRQSKRPYDTYLCAGFGLLITLQAFIHMAISIGWVPVTGLSLPLVSMGGSSVLTTCIELGIIQSVVRKQRKELYEGELQNVA